MTLIEEWSVPGDAPVDAPVDAPEFVESWLPDDPFELLALGHAVIDKLNAADFSSVPVPSSMPLVASIDELARRATALDVDAATLVDERGHERSAGFFSTRSCIKHRLRLSGPTALARTQTMRMFALLPNWADAARAGRIGSDQTLLMARVAANPRIALDLTACVDALLADAIRLPFDEFERRLRNFVRAADPADARASSEAADERRDATMKIQVDGSWRLAATLIDITEAAAMSLWADIRRVIHDGAGVVIELGRRRRLFTGSAREAALLLSMTCLWPGCDRPSRNCEVDHAVTWRQRGATDPGNGGPMCKRHNLLKENARFSTHRDAAGDWVVLDADGRPVG